MPLRVSSLPPGFSWLKAACRPTPQEVDAYAHIIADAEGYSSVDSDARLHDEAELQLWIWRTENGRKRDVPLRRTRTAKRERDHDHEMGGGLAGAF